MLGLGNPGVRNGTPDVDVLGRLVDVENMAFVLADRRGVIERVGGDIAAVTARSDTSEFVGRPVLDILEGLDLFNMDGSPSLPRDQMPLLIRAMQDSGSEHRLEAYAVSEDGRRIAMNSLFAGDGTMLTTLRDVTDILEEKDLLNVAVKAANAGYWSLDFKTGQFSYSQSVLSRLSIRERETISKNGLFSIIHPEDVTRISKLWQDIVQGLAPFDMTYRVVTATEGEMWQRSIGCLQRRPDGSLTKATAFVMDITKDLQTRSDLADARAAAKAKEQFLARMSHEIRTPLNAIIGLADSLSDEPLGETARSVVKDIEDAAESLNDLLSKTLDHAKLEAHGVEAEFDLQDPRDALEACARLWRPKIEGKGLAFDLRIDPSIPDSMPMDSFRLRQCVNNLLSNAVKFTEEGTITLAAAKLSRNGGKQLAVIVKDTGIGMDDEAARLVFEPFKQADGSISRQYGGTGLGLSITRRLAQVMGGDVQLRSAPGKGAAFILTLPFNAPLTKDTEVTGPVALSGAGDDAEDRDGTEVPFQGLSVLCVEDNPINQRVIERLIGKRVKQLHFADHGGQALSLLETVPVDVVLMDIHMPVMDGIETTLKIRTSDAPYADVIIIALTADPDYKHQRVCRNIGMNDTIAKPVRRESILRAFDRAMGSLQSDHAVRLKIA